MHTPFAPLRWRNFIWEWGQQSRIMGIVNMTPDSFAGDGLALAGHTPEAWVLAAAKQATEQVEAGAHVIDVGGASSRPGATPPPVAAEIARVVPAIQAIAAAIPATVPISIDTTSAVVAREALAAGASMVNDISGLSADPALAALVAQAGVPIVVMANMRDMPRHDTVADVVRLLASGIDRALAAGIDWNHIIVDPGFGFGHTPEQNVTLLRELGQFRALGRPILLGVSRKSTLGHLLGDAPAAERLEASLAAAVAGVLLGADLVRVHDVAATARALRVADAVAYAPRS